MKRFAKIICFSVGIFVSSQAWAVGTGSECVPCQEKSEVSTTNECLKEIKEDCEQILTILEGVFLDGIFSSDE